MEIDGEECMVFSKEVQRDWFVVVVVNKADLFQRVEANRYAKELKVYQATLEERVEEQTKKIKEQSIERIRMQEKA